jgi:hypothetical protein
MNTLVSSASISLAGNLISPPGAAAIALPSSNPPAASPAASRDNAMADLSSLSASVNLLAGASSAQNASAADPA